MNSCNTQNLCEANPLIIQGEKRVLYVKILNQQSVGQDMTGVGEIWATFPAKTSGQYVTKKKTDPTDPITVIPSSSSIRITLPADQTLNLKPAKGQTFFVKIVFPAPLGEKVFKVGFYDVSEAPAFA